jgi:hypothetical protein
MRRFRSLNNYLQAGLTRALIMVSTLEWAYFIAYGPTLACQCTLWPHSRAGDCYVADLSVYIGLMLLLSTAELGTESVAEL